MNISHGIIFWVMLVNPAVMAALEENDFLNPCAFPTPITKAPDYRLDGLNIDYIISNNTTSIAYDVVVELVNDSYPFLMIITSLCNSLAQQLAGTIATNEMKPRKRITLPVNNAIEDNYELVIRVISTTHQEVLETFPITLVNSNTVTQ